MDIFIFSVPHTCIWDHSEWCGPALMQKKITECTRKQNGAFSDSVEPVLIIFVSVYCVSEDQITKLFSGQIVTEKSISVVL
jgi:hypothetical protein